MVGGNHNGHNVGFVDWFGELQISLFPTNVMFCLTIDFPFYYSVLCVATVATLLPD